MKKLYKSRRDLSPLLKSQRFLFAPLTSFRLAVLFSIIFSIAVLPGTANAQPKGFVDEPVGGEWDAAVGLTFSEDGERMYVWEKAGKVWIVDDGEKRTAPLLDISEEVGNWGDHGLLGFALDPNFKSNGYIYLLYVVDRHHLLNFGKGGYSASANEYNDATIGRVTRYKVNSNGTSVDKSSRKVLLGETASTGIPILYVSHGIGSLVFGEDGSLLISVGDGATANGQDVGWIPGMKTDNFVEQGLKDGILSDENNVGAFRAQQVNSLNGKILRIDPATGNGLPSNPFYNSANPRADESRVWALGLRNPFRFTIRPGTGTANNPGVLYIGDVGWQDWEEINVASKGGLNFGWPLYEGFQKQSWYYDGTEVPTSTKIPNPLYGTGNCKIEFFYFKELILQPRFSEEPYFGNFCNWNVPIPNNVPKFVHTRPAIDWANAAVSDPEPPKAVTRTGTFNGEDAAVVNVGEAGSPVTGEPFYGSSSTGGIWYTGDKMSPAYKNMYFFGDYGAGWIKALKFDSNNKPTAIENFIDEGATVTAFAANPVTEELYYINYGSQIKKVAFYDGNVPPKAVAEADKLYGASPLVVKFTGSKSTDADGGNLNYSWDFGDGSAKATTANPTHTFTAEGAKTFDVTLTVTDEGGLSSKKSLSIKVNNTPPVVNIVSPGEGVKYPMNQFSTYDLRAEVTDAEDSDEQLEYEWVTALYHNTHNHPEAPDTKHETTARVAAVGCDGDTYFYRFSLKVTDSGGLSTTDYVDVYPDCSAGIVAAVSITSPANNASFKPGDPIEFTVDFADETRQWAKVEYFNGSSVIGTATTAPFNFTWNGAPAGTHTIMAKVTDADDHSMPSEPITITVTGDSEPVADLSDCLPGLVHYFDMGDTEGLEHTDRASSAVAACTNCPEVVGDGLFGGALRFNGTSTKLDFNNISNFNWKKDGSSSIGIWVRTSAEASATASNQVLIGRDAANSDQSVHWWIGLNGNKQAQFSLKDQKHLGTELGGGPSLNDGNWHYIMAVRDGVNNMNKLYVDGTLVQEKSAVYANDFTDENPVNIGYLDRAPGFNFEGDLDEIKVYDRAITAEEIASKFNGGSGTYCGRKPLGITDNKTFTGTFEVFPNPTTGSNIHVFVSQLVPGEQVRLVLTDITGRTILEHNATAGAQGTLEVSVRPNQGLSNGLYNLLLFSKERKLSRKVVVSH